MPARFRLARCRPGSLISGIAAEFIVSGAAREECALRVHTRQRPRRDEVFILRVIPLEFGDLADLFGIEYAAAIGDSSRPR